MMEQDTSSVALNVGRCVCNAAFGDKSGLATPDYTCAACGDNTTTCTFNSAGLATTTCATGFISGGLVCAGKSAASAPAGFFYDSTNSVFKGCDAKCSTCTGSTISTCTGCKAKDAATYTEPTSMATTYPASFAGLTRALINNTCFDACPTGFTANTARDSCVAGAAAAGGDAGSASGVFAVFVLIASLFIIF
jgi:hypothetical protein